MDYDGESVKYKASVAPYQAKADLSNVKDADRYTFSKKMQEKLVKNNFVVTENQIAEFFEIYEDNRYGLVPSFITSDSILLECQGKQKRTAVHCLRGLCII